jgi:hypothetical protein
MSCSPPLPARVGQPFFPTWCQLSILPLLELHLLRCILITHEAPVTVSGNIYGLQAVVSTSALIFLTLLWLTFTLVEAVDVHASHFVIGDEGRALFGRTWVEFLLNAILLRSWIGELILHCFSGA